MKRFITRFFRNQGLESNAVDYLSLYLKYHISTRKDNNQYLIFVKSKLRSIISERFPTVGYAKANKIINITLGHMSVQTKINKIITDEAVYFNMSH